MRRWNHNETPRTADCPAFGHQFGQCLFEHFVRFTNEVQFLGQLTPLLRTVGAGFDLSENLILDLFDHLSFCCLSVGDPLSPDLNIT